VSRRILFLFVEMLLKVVLKMVIYYAGRGISPGLGEDQERVRDAELLAKH
jgi:hypothetical protein